MKNLSITQKYFLLALGDKKKGKFSDNSELSVCFIASEISEMILDHVLTLDSKNKLITTIKQLPQEKHYLAEIYGLIKKKEPVKVNSIIDNFTMGIKNKITPVFDAVGQSLEAGNYVQESKKNSLLGTSILYETTEETLEILTKEVDKMIENPNELSEEQGVLLTLLERGKLLKTFISKDNLKVAKQRIKTLKNGKEQTVITKMLNQYGSALAASITIVQ